LASIFDKLIIKSNPKAKEEIKKLISNKSVLLDSKPKVIECMKRGPLTAPTENGFQSKRSKKNDGTHPPFRGQNFSPFGNGRGNDGRGDPPKPPREDEAKKNRGELYQRIEELYRQLNAFRNFLYRRIARLHPVAKKILIIQLNDFDRDINERIKNLEHYYNNYNNYNNVEIMCSLKNLELEMSNGFNNFKARIKIIKYANKQVNNIIQRTSEAFRANIDSLENAQDHEQAINAFNDLMIIVIEKWLVTFNDAIANARSREDIQNEIIKFERALVVEVDPLINGSLQRAKKAQTNFFNRKQKGPISFVTTSRKPKFAGPLNVKESINASKANRVGHINKSKGANHGRKETASWHEIATPFGNVFLKVVYESNGEVLGRLIVDATGSDRAMTYKQIFNILDDIYSQNPKIALSIAQQILDYLSTPLSLEDVQSKDILARFNSCIILKPLSINSTVKQAAATLCAILMFCESCEIRNATGGKLERAFIRRVLKNIEHKLSCPFITAAVEHYPPHLIGGVKITQDALSVNGPHTPESIRGAEDISGLGSDVSSDSDKSTDYDDDDQKCDK